jgi:hypothetical protein
MSSAAARLKELTIARVRAMDELSRIDGEMAALAAKEREDAVIDALALYGGSPSGRAKALATDLRSYAGNGWLRERVLITLPADAPEKRRAWHRLLRSRNGEPIGWRQILNISEVCNDGPLRLQTCSSESDHTMQE